MGNTILIADDEDVVLQALSRYFSACGFTVYPAKDCDEAIKLADQYRPDCFILDYHLCAATAEKVCAFIRANEYIKKNPVIILSGDPERAIHSYDVCQADVFVEKGRSYAEILSLVKRHLRRAEWDRGVLKTADLTLDASTLRLSRNSYPPIQLSPEQFRLLAILVEKSPDFVLEADVCAYVFADAPPEGRDAVWSLVYRLRQKLGPQLSRRIKIKRDRGWIYVQPRLHNKARPGKLERV